MEVLIKLFKKIGIPLTILTLIIFYLFNLNFMTKHNFEMITLNTILVGFLFTIYTLLVSLLDEDAVKTYSEMDELPKIYENIVIGIVLGVITCLLSMIILCLYGEPNTVTRVNKFLYSIDIACFLIVLYSMLKAILDMTCIVGAVRENKINKIKKDRANKEMEDRFKK